MANDMYARLADLLNAVEEGYLKEEEPQKKKLKRKKLKKKKKDNQNSDTARSRSPSPRRPISAAPAPAPAFQPPVARRPYSAHVGQLSSMPPSSILNGSRYTPTAPMTARASSPNLQLRQASSSQTAPAPTRPSMSLRPHSAAPAVRCEQTLPGPTISEKTAPKYTANSIKTPEMGSTPGGSYQAPPWKPNVRQEVDPMRKELGAPVNDKRFERVLAVPAHVLAQSLYHTDTPTAQARVRQLQEELKVARRDKKLVMCEKVRLEAEMKDALGRCGWAERQAEALREENEALRGDVAALRAQMTGVKAERDSLRHEVAKLNAQPTSYAEVMALKKQVEAAHQQMETLKLELRRALQLAAL